MNTEVERLIRFQGSCTFELKDSLHHPKFWWPQTLLTYRIDFSADAVSADRLALFDCSTNEQVPFQLSAIEKDRQGNLAAANVHFMASLGSGEQRSFQLRQEQRRTFPPSIRVTKAEQSIWVDNGRFAAQLPDSQLYPVQVPGPIMQVSSGANRYGNSKIDLGALRILEIVTECREMGDLFATFAVTYHFDGGKRYEALLTFTDQMDFVHFAETSERISEQDNASFQLYWSGLAPTHRHAPNNPAILDGDCDTPYDQLNWCKIDEMNVGGVNHPIGMWSNGKDGEIPFRLSLYEPQASIVKINAAAFWNETTGQSVGAFIVDEAKWDNGRYDLFCSWDGFAVRFYYNNGLMGWKYPLITGTRTTAIAVYAHEQDIRYFEQIRSKQQEEPGTKPKMHGASYCVFLQNRYSLLSLNKVKDFVLEYPDDAKRNVIEAKEGSFPDAESFEAFMMSYSLVDSLPEFGQRENAGFSPVPYRRMVRFSTAYGQFKDTMPAPMRKRIEAMLLLLTYLAASEEVVPLLRMLGGPPNLLGDIKRSLGYTAALFPEHPEAERWKELFAKFVETSLRLYTRPELPGLRLSGGRWAENLGTYTWAFLIPALHTAIVLEKHTGMRNLFTGPYAAMVGRWLVHSMTAPFDGENEATMQRNGKNNHFWGCFPQGFGPHRVYLPIGAHAARRTTPSSMREFAKRLERYDPLLAEQIHYVCSDLPDDFEARSKTLSKGIRDDERTILGTRPEFATTAFTGFGVMLRNGVYTDKEVSVFVQQIDEGPNYRWGTAGAGGNGNIYYYANGKAYSHNGKEDAGDRRLNDCEVGCNFGVWKNNKYTSIGQNIMKNAYHALGAFQFTAIESERDSLSYSYPEYEERNVLLSGTDYISIFDKTGTPAIRNRFIWSVSSFDQMPAIHLLTDYDFSSKLTTESDTGSIDSVWFEGRGSCFAVVSHRDDLFVEKRSYGAIVSTDAFKDTLFRSSRKLKGEFDGVYFEGTAAAIRESAGGQIDVALLQGHRLTGKGVSLRSESGKTGISISQSPDGRLSGFVSGLQQDRIAVSCEHEGEAYVYVDSMLIEPDEEGMYLVAGGEHTLQLVLRGELPVPLKPNIPEVAYGSGVCEVSYGPIAGADSYRVQISLDYGQTWHTQFVTEQTSCLIEDLVNGSKYFVRVCGLNEQHEGPYSHEVPVYPTEAAPPAPDGLDVIVQGDALFISWGKILGALNYKLYELAPTGEKKLIYEGKETSCAWTRDDQAIRRYVVSAVNRNGEGEVCRHPVDDDPASLRNYKPLIDRSFNRQSLYGHHPFLLQNTHRYRDVPSAYPDSIVKANKQ